MSIDAFSVFVVADECYRLICGPPSVSVQAAENFTRVRSVPAGPNSEDSRCDWAPRPPDQAGRGRWPYMRRHKGGRALLEYVFLPKTPGLHGARRRRPVITLRGCPHRRLEKRSAD